jgi:4-amino-4-deoxychorismate lyase
MLINGIPNETVAINDRALSYGDGVFETILLYQGQPVFLQQHLERLTHGCRRLGIDVNLELLNQDIEQLSSRFRDYGVLKIIISRAAGGRGYQPDPMASANRLLSLHAAPAYNESWSKIGIQAFLCQQRLAIQPSLAGIKHLNRLEQVLASQEWPGKEFQEGIMLDTDGMVIEGTKTNLFIVESGYLITPDLSACGVKGVMQKFLLENFKSRIEIDQIPLRRLFEADGAFVCNSIFGVWPLLSLHTDSHIYQYNVGEICQEARQVFEKALHQHAS